MTWARVVNNEIVEICDDDPATRFHPDLLAEWMDIPNEGVHVGWKLKNGTWISGGQWATEHAAENPVPVEGPPSVNIDIDHKQTRTHDQITLTSRTSGTVTSVEWTVDGVKHTTEEVVLNLEKGQTDLALAVSLKATGPGGSSTKTLEGEEAIVRTAFFTPLFQSGA